AELYGLPEACLAHVIAAPLLTNSGSPIVPATFNGTVGLSYVSVTQGRVGVYAHSSDDFPVETPVRIQTIAGTGMTYTTVLNELRISNGTARDIPAVMEGIGRPQINDQPVLGIIGYDILCNYNVLFDFPARRMVLFLTTDAPGCTPARNWVDADGISTPLLPDTEGRLTGITVQIGDHPVRMEIEPGADMSSLTRKVARSVGLSSAILHKDMNVRTNAGRILNGRRHHFDDITIGAWRDLPLDINIEKTTYNVLGMNFLRRRRVLLAFPQGMAFISPQQDMPDDRGRATHGLLSTRTAIARLIDMAPPADTPTPTGTATTP
ncbi:retroviral-like aspartic protease family protein, partial [Komagataeibacter kakiaceti]|uniref:retroviral-like aspartic protease family protein n=1 Tax=Komagataeibacter kakiaceti TaxID=943261 RepID=UPI000472840E